MAMISKSEATQIARSVILEHFPELASKRVRFLFVAGKKYDFYMATRWTILRHEIIIEEEILRYSTLAFSGCLAHELAHILIISRKSFFRRIWETLFAVQDETSEEREADKVAVERGLGSALIRFNEDHNEEYKRYKVSEGLTAWEIKRMMKAGD